MLPATAVEAVDGLEASLLSGMGTLDPREDRACYDHKHVHTDVLVVGAGPAGLAAAREAARSGARVMLLDEQPLAGGSLLSSRGTRIDDADAMDWADRTVAELRRTEDVTVLERTTVFGSYDANYLTALQKRTDHLGRPDAEAGREGVSRERVWHIRAAQVVLAPGAMDRPVVFAHNDRPGVMLAAAVQTYLNRYGVAAGEDVAVLTTNDSAWQLVADLHDAGIRVPVVLDSRPEPSARAAAVLEATGVEARFGWSVVDTDGGGPGGRLSAVRIAPLGVDGEIAGEVETVPADLLAVSGGLSRWCTCTPSDRAGSSDEALTSFVAVPWSRISTWPAPLGTADLADVLAEGARAGPPPRPPPVTRGGRDPARRAVGPRRPGPAAVARAEPGLGPRRLRAGGPRALESTSWTSSATRPCATCRALGAGCAPSSTSAVHLHQHRRRSGQDSGVAAIGVMSVLLGEEDPAASAPPPTAPPTRRSASQPLAGGVVEALRPRPHHLDPPLAPRARRRVEDVGQWKRPRYYPQGDEDMDAAVLRMRGRAHLRRRGTAPRWGRSRSAAPMPRGSSTASTPTASSRCPSAGPLRRDVRPDGMIMDDGVTMRLAEDRFFATTTSSGAAAVLDHLEGGTRRSGRTWTCP